MIGQRSLQNRGFQKSYEAESYVKSQDILG